jgi:hypothetical protein
MKSKIKEMLRPIVMEILAERKQTNKPIPALSTEYLFKNIFGLSEKETKNELKKPIKEDGYFDKMNAAWKIIKSHVPRLNQKYKMDIGAGTMGGGTVVWDSNREERGDYKRVAFISNSGEITLYGKLKTDSELLRDLNIN